MNVISPDFLNFWLPDNLIFHFFLLLSYQFEVLITAVTIFDRRNISIDGIHLHYISFYLESHRFHTKHLLIYSSIMETKLITKNNNDSKDNVHKDKKIMR